MNFRSHFKGYTEHLISAICEWIFVFLAVASIATFIPDFFRIKISPSFLSVYLKDDKEMPWTRKSCQVPDVSLECSWRWYSNDDFNNGSQSALEWQHFHRRSKHHNYQWVSLVIYFYFNLQLIIRTVNFDGLILHNSINRRDSSSSKSCDPFSFNSFLF